MRRNNTDQYCCMRSAALRRRHLDGHHLAAGQTARFRGESH